MKLLVQYGGDPFARHYGEETPLIAATGKVKEYLERRLKASRTNLPLGLIN
jgi:hypothetical protein